MVKRAFKFGAGAVSIVVFLALAAVLVLGPGRTPVAIEPVEVAAQEPQLSRIATPVTIPLEQLRQLADDRLAGEIYREDREITAGVRVDIVVLRRDEPIEMSVAEGWLSTNVPIRVIGTPDVRVGPFRLPGTTAGALEADIDVRLRTRVRLNPDWSVASETTADFEVGRAELTVADRVTDARAIVSDILDREVDRIAGPLDDYLSGLDVRAMMEPIWERFRDPIGLSQEPPVWLRVRPDKFSVSTPDAQAEDVRFDIGVEAYLDSFVGERPPALDLGPIPDLGETAADFGSFSVAIPVSLELAEATRILSERIDGREDPIGENGVVRWRGVTLSGTGSRLRVRVEFDAETGYPILSALGGVMTLEGRPSYDPASETLTMENIDYELDADSTLATLADWLLHDRLRERIQAQLVFPMAEVIADLRRNLQAELGRISFGEYGAAEAAIDRIQPGLRTVSNDTLEMTVVADGTMRLDLNLVPVTKVAD